MDNTTVWNAPGHDQPLLDALHGTLEEVIGVAHANPHWWNSNVLRHPYRRRLVSNFLNWYLNGQLPPNYDDQRGTIAYRYMNNLLTRFYDNPTLLLPVNNTVTVADPMVRNLRPRRQRRRLRRGDGDKENRPPTAGGALIPEAFYSKRTELNQLIADYATHNFMGFQEWRSTVPSITNEFMLHSQAQIQAEIEKMQGLIDQLRQIQASNWQRYAVGGGLKIGGMARYYGLSENGYVERFFRYMDDLEIIRETHPAWWRSRVDQARWRRYWAMYNGDDNSGFTDDNLRRANTYLQNLRRLFQRSQENVTDQFGDARSLDNFGSYPSPSRGGKENRRPSS